MRTYILALALWLPWITFACSSDDQGGQGGQAGSTTTSTMSTLDPDCPPEEPIELTECDQDGLECLYCAPGDESAPSFRCYQLWQPASLTACPAPPPHPSCADWAGGEPCPEEGVRCWVYNSSCNPGTAICSNGVWVVTPPQCPEF
jgi:hypothetical protein